VLLWCGVFCGRQDDWRIISSMVFSSAVFLFLFLPLVLIGYFNPLWKGRRFRNVFLLIASLVFYAWGEPLFVFVMFFSIGVNWFLGLLIGRHEDPGTRKRYMITAIVYDVSLLFVFKYVSFLVKNIGFLLKNDAVSLNIALPIGISFFTFQIMSYVFDVYYKKVEVQKDFINVALYVSLFPQLIAGPIVRYQTVAEEINNRVETPEDFTEGFARFVVGLGKKLLIANYVGLIADRIFALNGNLSVASAWLGIIAFMLQIFFDFSAYSDMAIGLGRMFGFHFLENFNYPYISKSLVEFWKRWHISLGTWFRDYVYFPMGGSRVSKGRKVFNLFVVWILTGIWHGANWTYMMWGLYSFVMIMVETLTGIAKKLKGFSRVYTLFFFLVGGVLFRAESIALVWQYWGAMFGVGAKGAIDDTFLMYFTNGKWILLAAVLLSTPIAPWRKKKMAPHANIYQFVSTVGLVLIFSLSLLVCIKSSYSPFIYFNF
jgi:D-alanyl-lipoteichoic acid acyltransferase DltB (MBOAT superfamily)